MRKESLLLKEGVVLAFARALNERERELVCTERQPHQSPVGGCGSAPHLHIRTQEGEPLAPLCSALSLPMCADVNKMVG